jgi:hypothetical protein
MENIAKNNSNLKKQYENKINKFTDLFNIMKIVETEIPFYIAKNPT